MRAAQIEKQLREIRESIPGAETVGLHFVSGMCRGWRIAVKFTDEAHELNREALDAWTVWSTGYSLGAAPVLADAFSQARMYAADLAEALTCPTCGRRDYT